MTHRRWEYMGEMGLTEAKRKTIEHNALYDAYEAERQRAEKAEKEVEEHRRHVSIQMSREAEARKALRDAEAALATEREVAKYTVRAGIHDSVCRERDRLAARVKELEARTVLPGVPSDEELAEKAFNEFHEGEFAWSASAWKHDWVCAIAPVRDAVLAALPVLTWEEVAKKHFGMKGFEITECSPDSFTGWLASRLPARLEPVAVTEEDIAEVLDDQLSMVIDMDLCKAGAAAVMSLLREKRVAEYPAEQLGRIANDLPEPIATAETLEQLAEIGYCEYYGFDRFESARLAEKQRWHRIVTAILRAARPEIDLRSASAWRSGESVLHAKDVPSLNTYIRYRVELPPDEWKAALDDALVCCDMTADSFGSPREAVQALLKYHKDVDDFFARDEMRERQIALYQQWLIAYAHCGWSPERAHEFALKAALSLPECIDKLNAALDAKGGE